MPLAARLKDPHKCPSGVIGTLMDNLGLMKVTIESKPAAVVGTIATPCFAGPNAVKDGSSKVTIGGSPAARVGDMTLHGSQIIMGASKVTIGG